MDSNDDVERESRASTSVHATHVHALRHRLDAQLHSDGVYASKKYQESASRASGRRKAKQVCAVVSHRYWCSADGNYAMFKASRKSLILNFLLRAVS